MRQSLAFALAIAGALVTSNVRAADFVLPEASDDPVHQCHNPALGSTGGYQIDWDGLGFDAGNPHGTIHISGASGPDSNVNITMSTQLANTGTFTDPPTGNFEQTSDTLIFASGDNATFNFDNILGVTLTNVDPVSLRGVQVDPLLQLFTLTIFTTTATYTFDLESIMGSQLNFNPRTHDFTAANLRFCGGLQSVPPPPPEIPEPTTLFGVGIAVLSTL
ncbi:MAG: hypothetical protein ACAI25_21385, partial [Planctomycetota bacterium]